ncbi:cilia- and flagella-associated protein 221-like [Halichoeres trimaculatus]|uniref:cilia- and flagella-associated protein 221-like n=1 Tax=Halichoeres trimaculatus TaxID=147232 RepID=UPI003D9DE438
MATSVAPDNKTGGSGVETCVKVERFDVKASRYPECFVSEKEDDGRWDAEMSPDRVFPSSLKVFCDESDVLALSDLDTLPVTPSAAAVTTSVPLFNLQVPQRSKLVGYEAVSAWEAFDSYIPSTFQRQLRSGDADNVWPDVCGVEHPCEEEQLGNEEVDAASWDELNLDFSAPESFLQQPSGNPLRIFSYKTLKYLESELDFHLCPVPRYQTPESETKTSHAEKSFLDREFWSRAVRRMDLSLLSGPSKRSELSCECFPRRSVCSSTVLLGPPPPLVTGCPGPRPSIHKERCGQLEWMNDFFNVIQLQAERHHAAGICHVPV